MDFGDFTITKREVLISISLIAILLMIGVWISGAITDACMDADEVYNKAVKIDTVDMFEYGMRTNVGNAFVYGDLKAVDTVTFPEIGGEYMYVEKVTEEYTRHTRTVYEYDEDGNVIGSREEEYWTWDAVDWESRMCNEISFLGVTFGRNKIDIPGSHYIDMIKESSRIRYKYYGTGTEFVGTIFTELREKTITDGTNFYNNRTIDETVELLKSWNWTVVFWVVWVFFIGVAVIGFYYIDNHWLE